MPALLLGLDALAGRLQWGRGLRAGQLRACPGNFACRGDAGVCDTTCASSADCAAGFVCNAGACVRPITVGPCTENDDCDSQRCGITGVGHCCAQACAETGAPCGATDCYADTGTCAYPTSVCGPVAQGCDGGTQINPAHCDGAGHCGAVPAPTVCAPYACTAGYCDLGCTEDGGCAAGGSCDLFHHVCCNPGLQAGGSMAVDAIAGDDSLACCGIKGNPPCQSITHAMQVIDLDQARDVTIHATVDGGSGAWPGPPTESYPILLGWGAELSAPGVIFGLQNNQNVVTFEVGSVSFNDHVGYASIVGAPGATTYQNGDGSPDLSAFIFLYWPTRLTHIQVESGNTLYLAGALIDGEGAPQPVLPILGSGIDVAAGGTVVLGADETGAVSGTTWITGVGTGIDCEGGLEGDVGCSLSDTPIDGGGHSLVINERFNSEEVQQVGIAAGDNTSISLASAPIIGTFLSIGTFHWDAGYEDWLEDESLYDKSSLTQGVVLSGKTSMTFANGVVKSILNQGFYLEASDQGVPRLNVSNSIIRDTGLGIYASAGIVTVSNSIISYNGGGVEQDTDGVNVGTIDLSGGAAGGTNVVACSNRIEGPAGVTGVSVLNTTSQVLNASNVAWDTSSPDLFQCDAQVATCSCEISSCEARAGGDSMDAVYESAGTVTTTGNTVSNLDCTAPYIGESCVPADPFSACPLTWMTCCPVSIDAGFCDVVCPPP